MSVMFDPSAFDENSFGLPTAGKKLFQVFATEPMNGVGATGKEWSAVKVHAVIVRDAVPDSNDVGKSVNGMFFIGDKAVELMKLLVGAGLKSIIDLADQSELDKFLTGSIVVGQVSHREVSKDDGTDATYAGIDTDRGCQFSPYADAPDPGWADLVTKAKEDHAEWLASKEERDNAKPEQAQPESAGGGFDAAPF